MKKYIAMFSGGKDSTAMLLRLFAEGRTVDEIVSADMKMEWDEMYQHIDKVEQTIGKKITRLQYREPFEFFLLIKTKRKGKNPAETIIVSDPRTGEGIERPLDPKVDLIKDDEGITRYAPHVREIRVNTENGWGYSWPDMGNRWCTALKKDLIKKYMRKQYAEHEVVEYHGIAADEIGRFEKNNDGREIVRPLVDWGMTEADCLRYCYERGFDWGGLYRKFRRVSCWCCPLKSLEELRVLYFDYPEKWNIMKEWDAVTYRTFQPGKTLLDLEERFNAEKEQGSLFNLIA